MRRASYMVLACLVCVAAEARAGGSGWVAPPVDAAAPEALRASLAEADRLFATREQGSNAQAALDALRELAKTNPDSWDVQWRFARAAFWVSEGYPQGDKAKRRALSTEGWEAGKKAVALKPAAPEGQYFMALCIGEYSHSIGIVTALREGIEAKFRDPLVAVSKSHPKLDHGGVWNALGRYKFELPWPKKDLDDSIAYLRKGIEVNPDNLRGRVYLAESLADRDDGNDEDEAKKLLAEVLAAKAGRYDTAEELRSQELAKATKKRLGWE